MLNKFIVILISLFCAVLIYACNCNCPKATFSNFNYVKGEANSLMYDFHGDSNFVQTLLLTDSIEEGKYGVALQMETIIALQESRPCWSLITTAYACDCVESSFTALDPIVNVKVFTLIDFDSTHAANTEVTSYFKYLSYDYTASSQSIKKDDINMGLDMINESIGFDMKTGASFYLDNYPSLTREMQFKFLLTTSGGKTFEIITGKVYLR